MTQKVPIWKELMYIGENIEEIKEFSGRTISKSDGYIKKRNEYKVYPGEYIVRSPDGTVFSCTENSVLEYLDII